MTNYRESLIDRMIAIYGFEHPTVVRFVCANTGITTRPSALSLKRTRETLGTGATTTRRTNKPKIWAYFFLLFCTKQRFFGAPVLDVPARFLCACIHAIFTYNYFCAK